MENLSIKLTITYNNCGIGIFWLRKDFTQNLLIIPIPFIAICCTWDVQLQEIIKIVKVMYPEEKFSRLELIEKAKQVMEYQKNFSNELPKN